MRVFTTYFLLTLLGFIGVLGVASLSRTATAACGCARKHCDANWTCSSSAANFDRTADICKSWNMGCTDPTQPGVPPAITPLSRVEYEWTSLCGNGANATATAEWDRSFVDGGDDDPDCEVEHLWEPTVLADFYGWSGGTCCVPAGDNAYIHARIFARAKLSISDDVCKDLRHWPSTTDPTTWTLIGEYKVTQKGTPSPCDADDVYDPTPAEHTFTLYIGCDLGCTCTVETGKKVKTELDFGFVVDNTGTKLEDWGGMQAQLMREHYECDCCDD